MECRCHSRNHVPRRVVLTGGPGAGKTAVLELVRQRFCRHVAVLPESAGIVFGGGFPRRRTMPGRRAAQRVIYHVQDEMERLVQEEAEAAVALCDRGTLDGAAYWPAAPEGFFAELGTTHERELARYEAVLHLRTPNGEQGYGNQNPLRVENAEEAAAIDARIRELWLPHPRRFEIQSRADFLLKASEALELLRELVPLCCRPPPMVVPAAD